MDIFYPFIHKNPNKKEKTFEQEFLYIEEDNNPNNNNNITPLHKEERGVIIIELLYSGI